MIQKFLDWLIDTYLSDHIVPRDDFDRVQFLSQEQDRFIQRQQDEINELLNSLWERKYQGVTDILADAVVREIRTERLDLDEIHYAYHFRVTRKFLCLAFDPSKALRLEKQKVIAKLTEAVVEHIRRKLFHEI